MSRMVQIRGVPDGVHAKLKARAAQAGMSLSKYLVRELTELSTTLTLQEVRERAVQRGRVFDDETPSAAIRRERDARG